MQKKTDKKMVEVRVEYRAYHKADEADRAKRIVKSFIDQARNAMGYNLSECVTILGGLNDFLKYQKTYKKNAAATLYDHERHLKFWAGALSQGVGDIALDSITIPDIDDVVYSLSETRKGGTVNKYLQSLFTFGRWARSRNKVPVNVALNWVGMDKLETESKTRSAFSIEEFVKLMRNWPLGGIHVSRIIWMMIFAGGRPGTLRPIKWRHIKINKDGSGEFPVGKLKKGKLEKISFGENSAIFNILVDAKNDYIRFYGRHPRYDDYVFVAKPMRNRTKPVMWSASAFSHAVSFHVERAAKKIRLADKFVAYNSRHSVLTWLAKEGVSDELRARFVGHANTAMQKIYVHLSGEDARPQREAIDELMGEAYIKATRLKNDVPENAKNKTTDSLPQLIMNLAG